MVEAVEIQVPDISPVGIGEFLLEFFYPDKKPVQNTEFGYSVNDGEARTAGTDNEGMLRVRVTEPPRAISLSLPDSGTATMETGTTSSDIESGGPTPAGTQVTGSAPSTAEEFPVEVYYTDQQPVKDIEFGYSVDDGETQEGVTDAQGVLRIRVSQPPRTIFLLLPG